MNWLYIYIYNVGNRQISRKLRYALTGPLFSVQTTEVRHGTFPNSDTLFCDHVDFVNRINDRFGLTVKGKGREKVRLRSTSSTTTAKGITSPTSTTSSSTTTTTIVSYLL